MGHRRVSVALVLWTVGVAATASADDRRPDTPTLRVLVQNLARVRPEVLSAAEKDAASIYAAAGVRVEWVDAATGPTSQFDVAVRIAAGLKAQMMPRDVPESSLGYAPVNPAAPEQHGRLVFILFDRVSQHAVRNQMPISRLCGLVMAHEIGHLLLSARHSPQGLMRAEWDLRFANLQYFTNAEADTVRARVADFAAHE